MVEKGEKMADAQLETKRRSGFMGELDLIQRGSGAAENRSCVYRFVSAVMVTSAVFVLFTYSMLLISGFRTVTGDDRSHETASSGKHSSVPQYFQTSPKLFAGMYPSG